ncbi:hypothetical protein EWM64_g10831, partial [Hericium alpestre]
DAESKDFNNTEPESDGNLPAIPTCCMPISEQIEGSHTELEIDEEVPMHRLSQKAKGKLPAKTILQTSSSTTPKTAPKVPAEEEPKRAKPDKQQVYQDDDVNTGGPADSDWDSPDTTAAKAASFLKSTGNKSTPKQDSVMEPDTEHEEQDQSEAELEEPGPALHPIKFEGFIQVQDSSKLEGPNYYLHTEHGQSEPYFICYDSLYLFILCLYISNAS